MSSERPVLKDVELPDLADGWWDVREVNVDSALALCQQAHANGSAWQGIAYSTCGAVDIRRVNEAGAKTSKDEFVDLATVYEMRLWRCDCTGESGGLRAHELRWVNGAGGVEVRVLVSTAEAGGPCWTRANQYLLHGQEIDGPIMASLEVFTEDTYGNVVFADELMTGKWA
ncbi:hypothetical protein [Schaalia canis]|uniref:Uncharacterized protein n=1 Tax=Schaalia canis TaxID=100469 RepID=A0A3P1SE85_9ACTO|nr:hypothetical protein [Schaalia canis]RRC95055.1 hypothetical protein EII11_07405 [Schaalia canis]